MSFVTVRNLSAIAVAVTSWMLVPGQAHAAWTGKGEAGLVIANGNTDTQNGNAKLDLATTEGNWKHAVGLAGLYATTDGFTSGQRWEATEQSDYNFSPRNFWFGAGRYEDDRFSGFEYQATLSSGFGHHFIDTEHTKLVGSAGIGYKLASTRDVYDDAGLLLQRGESNDQAVFRGTADYSHDLTATTRLTDKFLVESGTDNTFMQNDVSVQVKINAVLGLAAGYSVRHNSDPALGFKKTDTLTTLNLVYEVK